MAGLAPARRRETLGGIGRPRRGGGWGLAWFSLARAPGDSASPLRGRRAVAALGGGDLCRWGRRDAFVGGGGWAAGCAVTAGGGRARGCVGAALLLLLLLACWRAVVGGGAVCVMRVRPEAIVARALRHLVECVGRATRVVW